MRKIVGTTWVAATNHSNICVYICIASFFLGGLCGIFAARQLDGTGVAALTFYMQSFFHLAQNGPLISADFAELLWTFFRWPIFAVLCSMTVAGLALIPFLLMSRGFLLFFALSSLLRTIPSGGVVFVLLGLSALWSVPALIVLCVQGFQRAQRQRTRRERFYLSPRLVVGIMGGFLAGVLIDYYAVPVLFSALFHALVA